MSDAWKVSDGQAVSDVMADLCEIYWLHVTPQNMNSHLSHFPGKQRCHCWEYTQQLLLHISGYHTLPSGGCSESCWQRAGPQLSKNYAPEALLIAVIFSYILLLCAVNSWLKCRIAFESPTLKCLESFFHHILGGREDHENTKTFLPPPWGVVHHKHVFFLATSENWSYTHFGLVFWMLPKSQVLSYQYSTCYVFFWDRRSLLEGLLGLPWFPDRQKFHATNAWRLKAIMQASKSACRYVILYK